MHVYFTLGLSFFESNQFERMLINFYFLFLELLFKKEVHMKSYHYCDIVT